MTIPDRPDGPVKPEKPGWRPQTFGGFVYLLVVAMAVLGLVLTLVGPWRTGVDWIGAGLLLGAAARLGLSEHGAGMLRVRRRWSDVLMLVVVGVALLVLAAVVPDQPPR
ncbi:MAG TPA: DUF3017 domain-containing protein [Nocardioidaceae bacterium]|nr:DUF3017 domain-containing protein [Nocardioidaceae bacterium]